MKIVTIKTETIQLDQLLKWANVVSSGAEAKIMIQSGLVSLNGTVETRRAKKVVPGDEIAIEGYGIIKVAAEL
ncbi:MAG: RNA-binding S4 domain-containing protein [Firmicutes bacterium]|jgi:ribosome-associated protein|nr:RNA-binding S4 domain-containing protein [Bacillota bacterium]